MNLDFQQILIFVEIFVDFVDKKCLFVEFVDFQQMFIC